MKKIICFFCSILMLISVCCGMVACKPSGGNNPETLDIYLLYKGYQDEWLTSTVELFKQEDWVKEKYPNLTINYTPDGVDATATQKLSAGASINKYDLLFGVNLYGYDATGVTMDLTDALYLSEVPGETGVKVIDKIPKTKLELCAAANGPERQDGMDSYYTVNYIDGMFGMLYNDDILKNINEDVPVTTNEFFTLCEKIKTIGYTVSVGNETKTYKTPIMNCSENNYWATSFNIWWGQYEGVEAYKNFFNGIHNEERSNEVVKQKGRLKSLETIEHVFRSGYGYESSGAVDYKTAQTSFLSGNGVFHYNGSYFASEMRLAINALKQQGIDFNIKYMKMPVISSIVEKLDYENMSDEMLAEIIREIDNDVKYDDSTAKTNGISKKDFNKIAESRSISALATGTSQTAVIPDYSPAKNLAVDFLRFMYTDKAISNFARSSGGICLPSNYKYTEDDLACFSSVSLSAYQLMQGTEVYGFEELPPESTFALGKAGLAPLTSFNGVFEVMWADSSNTTKALDVYNADIAYWNDAAWGQLMARAGYSA